MGIRAEAPTSNAAAFAAMGAAVGASRNGFSAAKYRAERGLSVDIGVWSDSTADGASNPREWPYLLADYLAALYPTAKVQVRSGSSTPTQFGAVAPTVIQAGSTSQTITIWNFAVSGTTTHYGLAAYFNAMLRVPTMDCMILSHGLNHAGGSPTASILRGDFMAAVEQYRLYHPETPMVLIRQNPFQDNTTMDNVVAAITDVGNRRDVSVIDVHARFVALGKPTSLYNGDNTHPSATGCALYLDELTIHWVSAAPLPAIPAPSSLAVIRPRSVNLLLNGGFETWTTDPGVPDNWTAGGAGTLTAQKNASIVRRKDQGYSCELSCTTNQAWIQQDAALGAVLRGVPLTMTALVYRDPTGTSGRGRIELLAQAASGNIDSGLSKSIAPGSQDGWQVLCLSGLMVPTDANYIRSYVYADSGTPGATKCYIDQVTLVPGYLPTLCY